MCDPQNRDCLKGAVMYSTDSEIKCPFDDGEYQCEGTISETEIKAVSAWYGNCNN